MNGEKPSGTFGPGSEAIPTTGTPGNLDHFLGGFGNELPTSYWDSFKAQFHESVSNFPTQKAFDLYDQHLVGQDAGSKLHPNELNQRFPEVEAPFTEPMALPVAAEIARHARDRQELESIISHGPQGGIYGASRGAMGLLVGFGDPASLALGGLGGKALGASGLLGAEATTVAGRLGQNFAHGVAGAVLPEALGGYASLKDQQSYGVKDFVGNTVLAGAGYSALATGFHYAKPALAEFFGRNPEAARMSHESAISQMMMDRQVDVEPIAKDMHRQTNGTANAPEGASPVVGDYQFQRIGTSDDVHGRDFFHGSKDSLGTFKESPKGPLEDNLGHGVYLTDNAVVANGHATQSFTTADGKVYKVGVNRSDLQLINLDKRVSHGPIRNILETFLEEHANRPGGTLTDGSPQDLAVRAKTPAVPSIFESGSTMKEILAHIQDKMRNGSLPANALDELGTKLRDAGFDGYHYEGGDFAGVKNDPHNIVMLFDPEKTGDAGGIAQETGQYAPDRQVVQTQTPAEAQAIEQEKAQPEKSINHDPQAAQTFEELVKNPPKEMDIPALKEFESQSLQDLKDLHAQGMLDPEHVKHMEDLQQMAQEARDEEIAIKAGMACLGQDT
jgi:hypothetical protein